MSAVGERDEERTAALAAALLVGAASLILAALGFAHGMLRLRADAWPPAGTAHPGPAVGGVITVLGGVASLVAALATRSGGRPRLRRAAGLAALGATAVESALVGGALAPSLRLLVGAHLLVAFGAATWLLAGRQAAARPAAVTWHVVVALWLPVAAAVYL